MKKEYTCITCPRSCDLVLIDEDGDIRVSGNGCRRGEDYAKNEYLDPKRMITTTVRLKNGEYRLMPVVSSEPVPKEKLQDCLELLYQMEVSAPVSLRQVLVENILGTNVDILAAREARLQE